MTVAYCRECGRVPSHSPCTSSPEARSAWAASERRLNDASLAISAAEVGMTPDEYRGHLRSHRWHMTRAQWENNSPDTRRKVAVAWAEIMHHPDGTPWRWTEDGAAIPWTPDDWADPQ